MPSRRWHDAVAELLPLQAVYAAWLEALPDTATADALLAIVDLDLDTLAAIQPPRGYGRDWRRNGFGRSHGMFILLGEDNGLKGCAARTGWRRLRPLTPSPSPRVWR